MRAENHLVLVRAAIDLLFVWAVEIDFISVRGIELDMISVNEVDLVVWLVEFGLRWSLDR